MEVQSLSKLHIKIIVWTMLSLMIIIGMCIDLVAPSLPAIATGLSVSNGLAKGVISIYLFGYALGNFCIGFLTDAWGRRRLIRAALFVFMLASLLPAAFPNIHLLLFSRFLQGFMIGATSVLLRAICADVLSPEELTQLGPWFGFMWGIGPVIGPVIGGYLQTYYGWQAGFYFFAIITFIALMIVLFALPETLQHRHPLRLSIIKTNIATVLKNPMFLGIAMLMGLTYVLIITFNVVGPFLIQNSFHHTPLYFGHLALYLGLVFLMATLIGRRIIKKTPIEKLWVVGIHGGLIIILILLGVAFFANTLSWIILSSAFVFALCGILFPTSLGKGLSLFRQIAGTATAVMYLINIGITSLVAYFLGFLHVQTSFEITLIYAVIIIVVAGVYWGLLRRRA